MAARPVRVLVVVLLAAAGLAGRGEASGGLGRDHGHGDGGGAGGALLTARLVGPRRHVALVALLEGLRQGEPAAAQPRCLGLHDGPPMFKYALPVASEYVLRLGNCSDDGVFKDLLPALRDLLLFPDPRRADLCSAAAELLRDSDLDDGEFIPTKCKEASPAAGLPSTRRSRAATLQGLLGGEPAVASLLLADYETPEAAAAAASSSVHWLQPTPSVKRFADNEVAVGRGRRAVAAAGKADNDLDALRRCLAQSNSVGSLGLDSKPAGQDDDVVLVLGTTGVGKSTLVQFLTDRDDKLVSVEVGEGNYLIQDPGNKTIGYGVDSKTSEPELYTDTVTQTKLYDFPGFSDSRGACADIITAGVLRHVARSARSVKVVFVINHHSVLKGSDRLGFIKLLRHAASFVRRPDNYKDSVALVVTKVPVSMRKVKGQGYILESDDEVRARVADFLRSVDKDLDDLERTQSDTPSFYPVAHALVRMLAKQDDQQGYPRIGVFRKPDAAGPLSDDELLREAKPWLQNMIYKTISAAEPQEGDFGAPLSDAALLQSDRLAGGVLGGLGDHVHRIVRAARDHLQARRRSLPDVASAGAQAARDAARWSAALESAVRDDGHPEARTPRAFLRRLLAGVRDLDREAPAASAFLASLNDTLLVEFLQGASPEKAFDYQPKLWAEPVLQEVRASQDLALWYSLLADLELKLSSPHLQDDLKSLGLDDRTPAEGRNETQRRQRLLQRLVKHTVRAAGPQLMLDAIEVANVAFDKRDQIRQMQVDDAMQQDLALVLEAALRSPPPQVKCEPSQPRGRKTALVVRGRFVWLSEVAAFLDKHREAGCDGPLDAVHILAEHSLFLDRDLRLHDFDSVRAPAVLTIVAPRWHVMGEVVVSLDGADGKAWPPPLEGTGRDGLAGQPGGAGGRLMAVGAEVFQAQLLTLRALGGKGGAGQDGASGKPGEGGTDASDRSGADVSSSKWGIPPIFGEREEEFEGGNAKGGYPGGDGGAGGRGGPAGSVALLQLTPPSGNQTASSLSAVRRAATHGADGPGGAGGPGGKGGTHGVTIKRARLCILGCWFYNSEQDLYESKGDAESGSGGMDGANAGGRAHPNDPPELNCPQTYLNRARRQALSALWDRARSAGARRMLEQLDQLEVPDWRLATPAQARCLARALLRETIDLEEARWAGTMRDHARSGSAAGRTELLLSRFESLAHRISDAANSVADLSEGSERALHAALAAALSAAGALRSPARGEMVHNVREYLASSAAAVRALGDAERELAVWRGLAEARAALAAKARERQRLLDAHVEPAIAAAARLLQRATRSLDKELSDELGRNAESQRSVVKHHRRVREAVFWSKALRVLSTAWSFTSGLFTGGAASGVAEVALEEAAVGELKEALTSAGPGIEVAARMVREARDAWETVQEVPREEEGVTGKLSYIARVLDKVGSLLPSRKPQSSGEAGDMEQSSSSNMIEQGVGKAEQRETAVSVPEPAGRTAASAARTGAVDAKESRLSVDRVGGDGALALLSVREDTLLQQEQWLLAAEAAVERHLLPLVAQVEANLKRLHRAGPIGRNATAAAEASDAARALQAGLREVRVALAPLSAGPSGLAAPRELALCAELLDESLGALVALLGQLDECREQQRAAASVARMQAALAARDPAAVPDLYDDDDEELAADLARLKEAVRGNLVMERYNMAVHSFKQWVFPFALEYLNNTAAVPVARGWQGAVKGAYEGLSALQSQLELYYATIRPHDAHIRTNDFQDDSPLYEWRSDEHGEALDRLLEGQEVVMLADVRRSPVVGDAVKFDWVRLLLRADDPERQPELDQAVEDAVVSMTHLGDSYYMCGSKVYVISLESQRIEFSAVRRRDDGHPAVTNMVYEKLRQGSMMLSPFALWKVKLNGKLLHSVLATFKGQVHAVLEGHAQYVSSFECSDALEKFYTFEPSQSTLNSLII